MSGTQGPIPIRVSYEEPMVWRDAARGRERMASMRVTAEMPLQVVDMDRMESLASEPDSDWYGVDDFAPLERLFDGSSWRRLLDHDNRPMGLPGLRDWLSHPLETVAYLRMDLGRGLTTVAGEPSSVASGSKVLDLAVERYAADAAEMARDFASRIIAYDGACAWIRQYPRTGSPERPRNDIAFAEAKPMLLEAAGLRGVDPEIERLSAPVRRALARDRCGSLGEAGLPDALRALDALGTALCERLPRRSLRRRVTASRCDNVRRTLSQRAPDLPPGDDDALAALRPGGS